jgi:hypothetical protein
MTGIWRTRNGYLVEITKVVDVGKDQIVFGVVDVKGDIGKIVTFWYGKTLTNMSPALDLMEKKRSEEDQNF